MERSADGFRPRRTVVVDGANVVGARPDGWWRDRAGAAARLRDALAGLDGDAVVLVLEGRALAGAPAGRMGDVLVVHAAGSGDDEVEARVRELASVAPDAPAPDAVLVVTADRELRERVRRLGAAVVGPGWLHDRLDAGVTGRRAGMTTQQPGDAPRTDPAEPATAPTAPTAGQTGGLPGANAAPGTGQVSEDELADTVSGLGPAEGTAASETDMSTSDNG